MTPAGALLVAALLQATLFQVQGNSMSPTLRDGDHVLIDEDAERYLPTDIVAVTLRNKSKPLLKRIAAVGGDRVRIDDDGLHINGKLYHRLGTGAPYPITPKSAPKLTLQLKRYGWRLPPGALLLLGDNPGHSLDSSEYGLVFQRQLIGKAVPVLR